MTDDPELPPVGQRVSDFLADLERVLGPGERTELGEGRTSIRFGPGSLDALRALGQAQGVIEQTQTQHPDKLLRLTWKDPLRPVCIGCGRIPDEIDDYSGIATDSGMMNTQFVIHEEGTYNRTNGHFACDGCYLALGSPTSPLGWKAP